MLLLAAADLHGADDVYHWLGELIEARRPDALLLGGDLLGSAACPDQQREGARVVRSALADLERPVYFVMGNKDLIELAPAPGLTAVHGRRVECGAFNIVGYQFSLPSTDAPFEKQEDSIAADLESLAPLADERTILLTHSPAFGVLDRGITGEPTGSTSILRLCESRHVRAHVHGHVHRCFGRADRHFNVASAGRFRAMLIDVETMEHEAIEHV